MAEDAPPRKPAEMYIVATPTPPEVVVAHITRVVYSRALAWVVLCVVLGAMRCDDVRAVLPHRSIISAMGMRLVLGRTKMSGPDKIQKEVSVRVHRATSLTGNDWLAIGFAICESHPFNYKCDYLVMEMIGLRSSEHLFLPAG